MTNALGPILTGVVITAAGLAAALYLGEGSGGAASGSVLRPELSEEARVGLVAFGKNCAVCHGSWGEGTDKGPPLIHPIYEPSHHGDNAIRMAVAVGARPHHWTFGAMPPQPQVSADEIEPIIRFIRDVQRANGIR